jgi:hypothetical protein
MADIEADLMTQSSVTGCRWIRGASVGLDDSPIDSSSWRSGLWVGGRTTSRMTRLLAYHEGPGESMVPPCTRGSV